MARQLSEEEKIKKEEIKAKKEALRSAFERSGTKGMSEHEILSLLLSFSPGIKDPFDAASYLLMHFGSFYNVFNTPLDALLDIPFMDMNASLLIKSVPELCRRKLINAFPKNMKIKTPKDAQTYLYPYFLGYDMEMVFLLLVDKKYAPIKVVQIASGGAQSVNFGAEKILREALMGKAAACVLAHSHPGGRAKPSREDEVTTIKVASDLAICNILLLDHLIFAGKNCFCMSESKAFNSHILAFCKDKTKK